MAFLDIEILMGIYLLLGLEIFNSLNLDFRVPFQSTDICFCRYVYAFLLYSLCVCAHIYMNMCLYTRMCNCLCALLQRP